MDIVHAIPGVDSTLWSHWKTIHDQVDRVQTLESRGMPLVSNFSFHRTSSLDSITLLPHPIHPEPDKF